MIQLELSICSLKHRQRRCFSQQTWLLSRLNNYKFNSTVGNKFVD